MTDTIQYRKVIGLEYTLGQGNMKIDMEGTDHNYYSKLEEVAINPEKLLDLNNFEIKRNTIKMKFSTPVICNVNSGRHYSTMICGTEFEGQDKDLLVERLGGISDRHDSFKDESVQKKKEEIQEKTKNGDEE
jgi:hypothetical protein